MKTKIILKPKILAFDDFDRGLMDHGIPLNDLRKDSIYNGIRCMITKYCGKNEVVSFSNVDKILKSEEIVSFLTDSMNADASKKKYFENLSFLCRSLGKDPTIYHDKFLEYNRKTQEGGRPVPVVIPDNDFESCRKIMENSLQFIPIDLTVNSPVKIAIKYRDILLKILFIEFPVRQNGDYMYMKNSDDGKSNYYENGKIYFRLTGSSVPCAVLEIPEKYLKYFEQYHEVAKYHSDYFIFTEKDKGHFASGNFSAVLKNLFGIPIQSLRKKWDDVLEKTDGSIEYDYLSTLRGI